MAGQQETVAPALILFGSPGSGKGTQAKLIGNCLEGPHISTGDMLRQHITAGDEIGVQIQQLMKAGKLVPDELVNSFVEQRLQSHDRSSGVVLDGYPRTVNQAEVLLNYAEMYGFQLAVVHLVVDYDRIVARLSGRRQCPVCGTLYSSKTNPPRIAGVCDLDGAALITREDDRESVIRERLEQYDVQTRPLLEFFQKASVPTFEIDGAGSSPDQIHRTICNALRSAGIVHDGLGPGAEERKSVRVSP